MSIKKKKKKKNKYIGYNFCSGERQVFNKYLIHNEVSFLQSLRYRKWQMKIAIGAV